MKVGQKIIYIKNNNFRKGIILQEHYDDAPNIYYTIKLRKEEKEINTVPKYLITYEEYRKNHKISSK